jgi:fucose permease
VRFTATAAFATAVLLVAAVLAPSLPLSIGLFALAGFATGPVFPMIVAIGGDRYPDRAAAVSGFLTGFAVAGSIIYPPIMGFLSVTVGLTVAMLGSALLAFACGVALLLVRRPEPAT